MKRILVVGGANGIGLAMAQELAGRAEVEQVYVVDKNPMDDSYAHAKIQSLIFDLTEEDYSFFDRFTDIDALIITAGFGRLSLFRDVTEQHIIASMQVNAIAVMRLIHRFYARLLSPEPFYCGVMVSIAGFMSSPFFSVYGASKAALKVFIESLNVELTKAGTRNRILNVSPGSIKGTSFNQGATDLSATAPLACEILQHIQSQDDLFIPLYNEVFREVLERYHSDFRAEGLHSYEYKVASGRAKE